jgi:hypothetical protein
MSLNDTLHAAGLGRVAYRLWHQPLGRLKDVMAAGGPLAVRRTELGRREMEAAAHTLVPVPPPAPTVPAVHLLTGVKLWYQTVFFLHTLNRYVAVRPIIHDDGTLDKTRVEWLRRALPAATIVSNAESEARLDQFLPAAHYPFLRERRRQLVLFRKILDVHAGATGWRMFFDSDMLIFRAPAALDKWLSSPGTCLHMKDVVRAYGYDLSVLEKLVGKPVPDLVNTGILGLRSDLIDWNRMEWWCRTLIEDHGTHYYQEQALMAMHLATQEHVALSGEDYLVLPGEAEAHSRSAVLHHYVANSKKWYFRHCWRGTLKS